MPTAPPDPPNALPVMHDLPTDPKQLYRAFDELLDEADAGSAPGEIVTLFLQHLFGPTTQDLAASLGLVAGAAYEERRTCFHRMSLHGTVSADSLRQEFPLSGLRLTRNEPHALFEASDRAPWLGQGVQDLTDAATFWGACVVATGRERFMVMLALGARVQRLDTANTLEPSADLILHTLRSVLTSHLQKARWGSTMREAAAIQRSLLPTESLQVEGFDIAGVCNPAEEVGGDFFDALPISETSTGLVIGDASGHGLPAALVARDVIVGLRMGVDRDLRIAPTLEKLNRVIHRGGPASSFVSLFYGELESNGNLFYVNAGHKAPLLFRASAPAGHPPETLFSGDIVLGPVPDARFKRQFAHVDRGDCMVLYTDGVNERLDPPGELFGDERVIEAVHAVRNRPAADIARTVIEAAARFGQCVDWADDATVLVVKRNP